MKKLKSKAQKRISGGKIYNHTDTAYFLLLPNNTVYTEIFYSAESAKLEANRIFRITGNPYVVTSGKIIFKNIK